MKSNSRKTTSISNNSPFIYNLKDKTVYDSYKSFRDSKILSKDQTNYKLSNYTDISTTIGNNESLKKNRLFHNSLYTINDINNDKGKLQLSNEYENLKPREISHNFNKNNYLPELKLNNVVLNYNKFNKQYAKSKPKHILSKSIQTEYKIRLKSHTNVNSYEYNDNITTYENMKEKHNPVIKSLKSRVIKPKYTKEFIDLKGNKIDEFTINQDLMNSDKKISIKRIPYSKVSIDELIENIRKHDDTSNLQEKQNYKFNRKSSDKPYASVNKNDYKMYKDIFDRPIIFKDSNNKEFKLSDKEYDIIYDNKLADNLEQDENKLLITNKKSWLVKGIIDHIYPKVMIIRTNLVRNGLIKK